MNVKLSASSFVGVRRDGSEWKQSYARGKPASKMAKAPGEKVRGSGTTIRFRPEYEIESAIRDCIEQTRARRQA